MASVAKSAAALVTLASLSMSPTYPFAGEAENHQDDTVDADWNWIIRRHEGDACILYLYRLRKAICAAIDAGTLTHGDGIHLFEAARRRIVQESEAALKKIDSAQRSI